jgi:hypothetical protein
MQIRFPFRYERIRSTTILDERIFKVCDIKEKEIGIVRRWLLYLHFNGKTWKILLLKPDLSEVKYFELQ